MSYLVYLLNDRPAKQPKILDSFSDTARLLKEQFQLEACHDASGNFICFAPPEQAERLPENEHSEFLRSKNTQSEFSRSKNKQSEFLRSQNELGEDTAVFYQHNEQEGGSLWLKNPSESQLQLLLDIMLALNDGSYVLGDAGESYRVKKGAVVYTEPPEPPSGWRGKAL
ncbi:hypothetical protein [Eikenella sp. Marseille-P7795]|uniref:hypothetical protein n=1 Tax=Eikenella sp. Marseille-P7795 TaxID=2866577 RepID=UPI001CE445C5|nr:hypothetical protein [Eikenella sp. Marseille-P7795]